MRMIDTKAHDLQCLAFSPGGTTIATGEPAGEVKLWDTATGECLKTTRLVENQSVFSLSFAADGKTLATNQQGKVSSSGIWKAATLSFSRCRRSPDSRPASRTTGVTWR